MRKVWNVNCSRISRKRCAVTRLRNTHYQLVNPSEFWAVNGPRILQERFTGRGSWRAETKQWIKEMIEHIKGTIGLRSDAPVLKALDELLNPERTAGERRSERDLSRS